MVKQWMRCFAFCGRMLPDSAIKTASCSCCSDSSVAEGLIDQLGSLQDAISCLYELIEAAPLRYADASVPSSTLGKDGCSGTNGKIKTKEKSHPQE